jgi:SAM-dependent methyltransferase
LTEWFERWFGEEYLALYPHRDEVEAERLIALLQARGVAQRGDPVLDMACGAGRHMRALAARGARVIGLDLSMPLLLRARGLHERRLVRGDMRCLPFADGAFTAVLNLFTSFGYFDGDAEHDLVLREVGRVLRSNGVFVLDFLNAPRVRTTLVARDECAVGQTTVVQERRLSPDRRHVIKNIHIAHLGRSFEERVRLFERAELEAMLREAGLTPEAALGDYEGGSHSPESPRLLLLARRS